MLAFECAMDELAEQLGLDPIELRIRNEPSADPERSVPVLDPQPGRLHARGRAPLRLGAPQRRRRAACAKGRKLIGMGMAAAIRPNYHRRRRRRGSAIDADGRVTVRLDMTDIGTGTYTILTQIAAETPRRAAVGGQGRARRQPLPAHRRLRRLMGRGELGSALHDACAALRQKIVEAARSTSARRCAAPMRRRALRRRRARIGDRSERLADLVAPDRARRARGRRRRSARGDDDYKSYSQHAYGAHFAEVAVDCDTGEIRAAPHARRVRGRPHPQRQDRALADDRRHDLGRRRGADGGDACSIRATAISSTTTSPNTTSPVNADIPDIEVVFLEEHDDKANPLGAKGLGELGICGAGAAVANAVYNATGVRVREFPITLDKLLPDLAYGRDLTQA